MARLIPKTEIESISLKPERDVARALVTSLGDECVVYHSYPWLRPERHDRGQETRLNEGEADFVIVDPAHGLLVLEVKGGEIFYDPPSHTWQRVLPGGRRKEITDPFKQGQRNIRELVRQVAERSFRGRKDLPCPFGHAVIFPDCEFGGEPPPGADPGILLTSKDLPFLNRRIPEILRKWGGSRKVFSGEEMAGIRKGLSPVFHLIPILSRQLASQEELLVRLTEQQEEALKGLYANERVLVQGTAGSGKTMLAMARARRFAEEGKETLFLCYNKALGEWLQDLVPADLRGLLTVSHFHKLCSDCCRQAGVPFRVPDEESEAFWRDQAADLLDRAIDRVSSRYEAVIVDEGQDFSPNWWMPIELLNARAENGPLYVFYDPAQNLFVDGPLVLPNFPVRYCLSTNCRNTRLIAQACGQVLGITIDVRKDAPHGIQPRVEVAPQPDRQRSLCDQQIREWIGRGKLEPRQVAVLSPRRQIHSSLAQAKQLGGVSLVTDPADWREGKGILFATVRAFKGLEADALLLVDIAGFTALFTKSDLYVACSRAKHLLTILGTVEGLL